MASPVVDVYVKLPTGKTCNLEVMPGDNTGKIYNHVAEQVGVPADRVVLKYNGKVIDKSKTVGYLGIRKETILKAEIITVKQINVYVKWKDGKAVPLQVQNVSPIHHLKERLQTQEGVDVSNYVLKFSGRQLSNQNQTLLAAGVTDESIVHLEEREAPAHSGAVQNEHITMDMNEGQKEEVLSSFDAGGRPVEVVFSFDTTGSMYSVLDQVRLKLRETVTRLLRDIPGIRIGLIAHGDYCDCNSSYVVSIEELTSDVDRLVRFARDTPRTGGGDAPEAYEWVLRKAQQMDWSEDSAKALVMIGDCEPHGVGYTDQNINWHDELDVLKGMGVKVYGVQAMNAATSKPFYEELAERTGGAYLTFRNFPIITDMFLAVCYREADPSQLQAFSEEVEVEGRMTEEVKDILTQLKETPKEPEENPRRRVNVAWWDPQLSQGDVRYCYDAQNDKWSSATASVRRPPSPDRSVSPEITRKSMSPRTKAKKKTGCVVM